MSNRIDKYLKAITEQTAEGHPIKEGTKLVCKVCGRIVTVDKKGKGPLICCMEQMHLYEGD